MRNIESWKPTKYEPTRRGWRASSDRRHLSPGSRLPANRLLQAYLSAIAEHARGHVADLGCGQVPLFGCYRERAEQVTCIDWEGSLHDSLHVDILADLNAALPLADGQFDTIISTSVLEHIWRHETLWDEMFRLLAPGGRLILGTPFLYWVHEEPHDYFRWTRFALARACEERGMTVLHLAPYGGGLDVAADILIKMAAAVSPRLASILSGVAGALLARGPLRRLSDRSRDKLPMGYLLVAEKPSGR